MALLVTVLLQRSEDSVPWGFRIQGGADYNQPLSVQRVTPGTLASQHLTSGDVLIMVEGQDARTMCHFDACELIKSAGNSVELIVRKANSKYLCAENLIQQEKLEQQIIDERYRQEEEKRKRKVLREAMSPPFSSESSATSFSPHSTPAGYSSPHATAMSPVPSQDFPGKAALTISQLHPMQRNILTSSSQLPPQDQTFIAPLSSTFQTQTQSAVTHPPIPPPPTQTDSFLMSLPTRPSSQKLFPTSPPLLPSLPKPFAMSPPIYPIKGPTSQAVNLQERVQSAIESHAEISQSKSTVVSSAAHQMQRTFKSQTISSIQQTQRQDFLHQLSRDHSSKIKSPPQRIMSPQTASNVQRRTSCSPQRIIPPLPKTIFPDDKTNSKSNLLSDTQKALNIQENQQFTSPNMQCSDNSRPCPENEIQTRSFHLISPKPFTPLLQETDVHNMKTISSPPVHESSASQYSTPMHIFSPQSFHYSNQQQTQSDSEINPQLLSKKLQALQQTEDISSSSHSSSYAQLDQQTSEKRSHSQEREPVTVEEYKQRQLQKLIEEKVRLEEMMMIAKRRQSITEGNELQIKKKEFKEEHSASASVPSNQTNAIVKHEEAQKEDSNVESISEEHVTEQPKPLSNQFASANNKNSAIREEEEEDRLRKENQIRDEKIRKMQERRYEEKLKRNGVRSARDKSCPPETTSDKGGNADSKGSKSRRSRERTREGARGRVVRDRSCPVNLDQRGGDTSRRTKPEGKKITKDQPSLASSFISAHLGKLNIGIPRKTQEGEEAPVNTSQNMNPNVTFKKKAGSSTMKQSSLSDVKQMTEGTKKHNKVSGKETVKDRKGLEERKELFEILKKDQQRIQEEFRKREVKKMKEQKRSDSEQKQEQKTHDQLQYEAQKWHEQLQIQKEFNKQEELKLQERLKMQEELKKQLEIARQRELQRQKEAKRQEEQRMQEEFKRQEEMKRLEEQKRQEELKQHEEQKRQEELKRYEEQKRQEELKRLEEQKRQEELRRLEEQKRQEELKRLEEQKKQEELKRNEEQKRQEELKRLEEQKRQEELKRLEEQKRQEELKRLEQKRQEELKRLEEQKRQEELKRLEEQKIQEELKRQEELKQLEEQQKRLEELKRQEELQWQELEKHDILKRQEKLKQLEKARHKEMKRQEDIKKQEKIRKQEEERQEELKKRENYLKMEENKLIERIINEEQKRILEERKRRQNVDHDEKHLTDVNKKEKLNTSTKLLPVNKGDSSGHQDSECCSDEDEIFYQMKLQEEERREQEQEEARIEELRKQEEEKMKEEAKLYEEYKRHLETKRKTHMYDSDDYASEVDTGEEDDDEKRPRGVYLEEKFDELKATSEEELFEAQEKSIRNLERQIRKQKQREMRRNYDKKQQSSNQSSKEDEKASSKDPSLHQRHYSSTGDLQSNPSRTLPVTKFSPDPMEFGFRPIETPHSIISRSTGNLMTRGGPSASSIAHVAGAEAGVAAIKKPITKKYYYKGKFTPKEAWENRFRISSSLEDLQQVSRKPPLPLQAKLRPSKLRHATSEETISKSDRPCEDPRRHTYTEGEDFSELASLNSLELNPLDYGRLLNEYYAAYYDTYYQSYFK